MALYAKYVLPRLIDLTTRNKDTTRLRAEWIPLARVDVLEIGIGSGLNLAFYSSDVQRVYGVDPSAELQRMARKRADGHLAKVEFIFPVCRRTPAHSRQQYRHSCRDLDTLLDPGPSEGASADEENPQAGRMFDFCRTRPRT